MDNHTSEKAEGAAPAIGLVGHDNAASAASMLREDLSRVRSGMPEGTVVRFRHIPSGSPKNYQFAAIFVNDCWWLTGVADSTRFRRKMEHEEFVAALGRQNVYDVQVAQTWAGIL